MLKAFNGCFCQCKFLHFLKANTHLETEIANTCKIPVTPTIDFFSAKMTQDIYFIPLEDPARNGPPLSSPV